MKTSLLIRLTACIALAAIFIGTPARAQTVPTKLSAQERELLHRKLLADKADYDKLKKKAATSSQAKPSNQAQLSETLPPLEGASVDAGSEEIAKKEQDIKDAAEKLSEDELARTWLRQHGFNINLGYGYYADLKTYAPDVQVRYNFFQKYQIADAINNVQQLTLDPTAKPPGKDFFGGHLTDLSGWIGYPLEKLENRVRTVGTTTFAAGTVKESPLVVGVGIGLGGGPEFSSAVSINVGVAVFKNQAFRQNQFYVGVSLDAILFKKVTAALSSVAGSDSGN